MKRKIEVIIILGLFLLYTLVPLSVDAEDKTRNDNYDMIIIAPSSYESSLQPLIQHKNNRSIITKFISLDDIYSGKYFDVKGRDDPEKIKYFIKDSIESWGIAYVLFVGSINKIPVRYSYTCDNYSLYHEPKFISELYYADIYDENDNFSTWDTDRDGFFGEWNQSSTAEDKPIDLTPDVCLGRLACIDTDEVETMVTKIINYEKKQAASSWFKRMVVVGGDTYDDFEGYEGEIVNQIALDIMNDFVPVKVWGSTGTLTDQPWSISKEINKGCGFIYLSGHGSRKIWVTYDPEGNRVGNYKPANMNYLFNKNKLPVCLVGGCHISEFETIIEDNEFVLETEDIFDNWKQACWSWRLASVPTGGSIATFGATGLSWYGIEFDGGGTDWLHLQFFREYQNDVTILGQIWKNALTRYLESYPIDWDSQSGSASSIDAKTVEQWTMFGDPSLKIGGYSSNSRSKVDKSHASSNLLEIIKNINIITMIESYINLVKMILQNSKFY